MLTVQNNRWKNKETIMAKIREVWAASLDSCKCGQQVWTAVLSIDSPPQIDAALIPNDVNPVKNNETQQRKGTQDRSMDRFEGMTSTRCL
jgi:hypothetical protein